MESEEDWYEINVATIQAEKEWLLKVLEFRFCVHWDRPTPYEGIEDIEVPLIDVQDAPYKSIVIGLGLGPEARLVLILALAPHLFPAALDQLMHGYPDQMPMTVFGGLRGQGHKGFLPTIETALYLLAGDDLGMRIRLKALFSQQHPLFGDNWLRTEHSFQTEPPQSAVLLAGKELVEFVTTGHMGEPEFGPSFPAQKIVTDRNWDDLVLPSETKNDIQDIISWVTHEQQVMKEWRLAEKVSPGFRCLFHGPPGTGKTFTATLLGKATGRDVYRIDLSMVVSKYIGETEKNLKVVFDKAQSRGWILFFDEADALFGKRTDVSDSKDRYANQEVSYLLQRVESFDGVVILATNNRDNMDKAFTRRFQVVVNFPMPNANERLRLWETGMPEAFELAPTVNLLAIADRYEMAGGSIMNVIRHCALRAAMRGAPIIEEFDMVDGIRREFRKAGRILN
jgi:AAA+ superfamily predicted ATPase